MLTPEQQVPPADLQKLLEQWVAEHLGFTGTVVLALLLAILALWWNWEKIQKLPGVAGLLARRSRRPPPRVPLPKALPGRFSVAVVHLDNDKDGEHERLVLAALDEVSGVQVLLFDRVIAPKGNSVEEAAKKGHEQARALLAESGTDVLIWGTVLRADQKSIARLHWTTPPSVPFDGRSRRYQLTDELNLPELSNDLTAVLDLLVLSSPSYTSPPKEYARGEISALIERLDKLFGAESSKWPIETRGRLRAAFGDLVLAYLGSSDWQNTEMLEKAQAAYGAARNEYEREPWSVSWYEAVLYNLAETHFRLGIYKSDSAQVQNAIACYRKVAELSSRRGGSWSYMHTKTQLGHALRLLGEWKAETARLVEALDAYIDAAGRVSERDDPDHYRGILFGRAESLRLIGERESGTARLEQALPLYRELLKSYGPGEADLRKQAADKLASAEREIQVRTEGHPDARR